MNTLLKKQVKCVTKSTTIRAFYNCIQAVMSSQGGDLVNLALVPHCQVSPAPSSPSSAPLLLVFRSVTRTWYLG